MTFMCNYSINNLDRVRESILIEKNNRLRAKVQINQYFKGKKCYLPLEFLGKEKHVVAEKGQVARRRLWVFIDFQFFSQNYSI